MSAVHDVCRWKFPLKTVWYSGSNVSNIHQYKLQIQADVGLYRSNIQQYKLRIQAGVGIYRLMRINFLPFSFSSFYALLYMHPPKLHDVPNRLGNILRPLFYLFGCKRNYNCATKTTVYRPYWQYKSTWTVAGWILILEFWIFGNITGINLNSNTKYIGLQAVAWLVRDTTTQVCEWACMCSSLQCEKKKRVNIFGLTISR